MKTFRNFLRWLLGGSFSLIIAACYGIPADYQGKHVKFKCKNTNNEPIPSLQLKFYESGAESMRNITDTNGVTEFFIPEYVSHNLMFQIIDVDGTSNLGDFQTQVLSNLSYDTLSTNYVITMTNK